MKNILKCVVVCEWSKNKILMKKNPNRVFLLYVFLNYFIFPHFVIPSGLKEKNCSARTKLWKENPPYFSPVATRLFPNQSSVVYIVLMSIVIIIIVVAVLSSICVMKAKWNYFLQWNKYETKKKRINDLKKHHRSSLASSSFLYYLLPRIINVHCCFVVVF